ncbi:hypothetical protein C8R46DRAFT_639457 [Mycena filopes]|nr:hypothetical protein C8R46DRAFT_639457 [Mycena filopes]
MHPFVDENSRDSEDSAALIPLPCDSVQQIRVSLRHEPMGKAISLRHVHRSSMLSTMMKIFSKTHGHSETVGIVVHGPILKHSHQFSFFSRHLFAMAPAGGCSDCGLVFKHLDPDRDNCFKCEKRNKCGTDAIKLAEVEKLVQCMGCGVAYKYFPAGRTACGSCEAKDDAETGSSKLKQSEAEKENKKIVIDVDDSDSDAGFDGKSELNAKVQRQKDAASRMRLTRKTPEIADSIPTRSREFLDKRENARKRGGDAAKAASILFKVSVVLHKDKGQRQGTRVPSQSRGFSLDDNMQHVFKKLVDMVNERDGPWAQYYPNKTFSLTDVQFTFKDHVGIQPKFNSPDMSVSKFWTLHTQLPGQYFKKASISASTAEIDMLVPIEITVRYTSLVIYAAHHYD